MGKLMEIWTGCQFLLGWKMRVLFDFRETRAIGTSISGLRAG